MTYWKFSVEEVVRDSLLYKKWKRRFFFQYPALIFGYFFVWTTLGLGVFLVNAILLRFNRGIDVDFGQFTNFYSVLIYRWNQFVNSRLVARFVFQKVWGFLFLTDHKIYFFAIFAFAIFSVAISRRVTSVVKSTLALILFNRLRRLHQQDRLHTPNEIISQEIRVLFADPEKLSLRSRVDGVVRLVTFVQMHKF